MCSQVDGGTRHCFRFRKRKRKRRDEVKKEGGRRWGEKEEVGGVISLARERNLGWGYKFRINH